jgi:hypothetical protein
MFSSRRSPRAPIAASGVAVDLPGDQDAAQVGYAFKAGRDVDAFAVNPLIIKDYIAEVDADPELESSSVGSEAPEYRVRTDGSDRTRKITFVTKDKIAACNPKVI